MEVSFTKGLLAQPFSRRMAVSSSLGKTAPGTGTPLASETSPSSQASRGTRPGGYLTGILSSLKRVALRFEELSYAKSETLSADQQKALDAERTALQEEYTRITTSSQFKQFQDTSAQIESLLKNGSAGGDIYKALNQQRGILGEDYLDLVSGYAISNISNLNGILRDLGSAPLEKGTLTKIDSAISNLDGPRQSLAQSVVVEKGEAPLVSDTPEISEMQFVLNSEMAISLVGYAGTDLLKAALSGAPPDVNSIRHLMIHVPRELDEDEKSSSLDPETEQPFYKVGNEP